MKAFITVMGHDTVGVVAKVSTLCSELNINIEDVTQSILQGMFAMIMLVDISKCSVSHEELHQRMDALAKEMGMQINLTRQEVFDAMHTIREVTTKEYDQHRRHPRNHRDVYAG